jgi:UDP-N-acetylmuramate dehydrogenase
MEATVSRVRSRAEIAPVVPLAELTTLRLGGPAGRLVRADSDASVVETVRAADRDGAPLLLVGGGSNLVVADAGVPGTTVQVCTTGREARPGEPGTALLTVAAGEDAYGVEIAELLADVDLYDRRAGVLREHVPAAALRLGYRTSALKGTDDAVVLRIRLVLSTDPSGLGGPIRYAELAGVLGIELGGRAPAAEVREAVLALRRAKGMVLAPDDHDTWSAGSFFTNPVLAADALPAVLAGVQMPSWPQPDGRVKLSAAWLISHAGFERGHPGPGGRVSLSHRHSLALTNRGAGTTEDLLALARQVRDGVRSAFGVELTPEPVLVGCSV